MSWGWNGHAALNIMRGAVVVTYAPNMGSLIFVGTSNEGRASNGSDQTAIGKLASAKQPVLATAHQASALPVTALSFRQREVLSLIVQGRSNKEIARSLALAEGTVKIHVAALFGKLGVHRRAALAVVGIRLLSDPLKTEQRAIAAA